MYIKLDFDKYKEYVIHEKKFDLNSNCEYIFTTIKKHTKDGKRIFPRVRTTNKDFNQVTSLYDFMVKDEILFAINAGIFNTGTNIPECVLMIDKKILVDRKETYIHKSLKDGGDKRDELYILGIDSNGNFKIYEPQYSVEHILSDGCVDAIMGFVPIIINYKVFLEADIICSYSSYDKHPRQIIGQYINEDFFILTINEPGMTFEEVRNLLKGMKISMAYNLDGGSSTQTIFHKKQLNPTYREKTGRKIPTVITFEVITGELVVDN